MIVRAHLSLLILRAQVEEIVDKGRLACNERKITSSVASAV
jgi:hypothetical protein